jgi:hypothetical protein
MFLGKDMLMMYQHKISSPLTLRYVHVLTITFFFCIPAYGAEPIDGFRDLKFGMSPQEVQALSNCSTPHECIYELSDRNRYVHLSYATVSPGQGSDSTEHLQLTKATIDMGQFSKDWYKQLQMILGKSYRLTNDYTDDTMNAFLSSQLEELQAGYEDGQVVLTVIRRQFGNMILRLIYQNTSLAADFARQRPMPSITTPK